LEGRLGHPSRECSWAPHREHSLEVGGRFAGEHVGRTTLGSWMLLADQIEWRFDPPGSLPWVGMALPGGMSKGDSHRLEDFGLGAWLRGSLLVTGAREESRGPPASGGRGRSGVRGLPLCVGEGVVPAGPATDGGA
jgi:hypothetical protein